ncbi:MAG: response regulator transcription factor [Lachnospirales bacterium]
MLIEDDRTLSNGIILTLADDNIKLLPAYTLNDAKEKLMSESFDLIILDINLPDGNGLDFIKTIKNLTSSNFIILTANDTELDIITGLEMGANDYITKPFSLGVLRARVRTQLRYDSVEKTCFKIDDLYLDFTNVQFYKNDCIVELSKTEQRLLHYLVKNKNITLKRDMIVDKIWTDNDQYVNENALSVSIKRLRDKLEDDPSNPKYIKTIYGIGYSWKQDE